MVTKNAGQYNLSQMNLQEDVQNFNSGLQTFAPRMDFYCPVIRNGQGSITYDSDTNKSTIPHLFNDDISLKPVVMTSPSLSFQSVDNVRGLGDLFTNALPGDSDTLASGTAFRSNKIR